MSNRDYIVVVTEEITPSFSEVAGSSAIVLELNNDTMIGNQNPAEIISVIEAGPQGAPGNNTLASAVAGSRFTILWDEVAWPNTRPSNRTDIYFDLIGGDDTVDDPDWMIDGDAREVVV